MPLLNALLGNYRKAEHLLDKHPNLKIRLRRGSREGAKPPLIYFYPLPMPREGGHRGIGCDTIS